MRVNAEARAAEQALLAANIREFHIRVEVLCSLVDGGKLDADGCLDAIEVLWGRVTQSRSTIRTHAA